VRNALILYKNHTTSTFKSFQSSLVLSLISVSAALPAQSFRDACWNLAFQFEFPSPDVFANHLSLSYVYFPTPIEPRSSALSHHMKANCTT